LTESSSVQFRSNRKERGRGKEEGGGLCKRKAISDEKAYWLKLEKNATLDIEVKGESRMGTIRSQVSCEGGWKTP